MALCYNRLWKLLIDRGMTRTQMRLAAGISTSTLAKLSKGEDVNSSILVKICDALQCNIGDIADCVPEATPNRKERHHPWFDTRRKEAWEGGKRR